MQGKILIVDGISTNRIVLKVKLTGAFYQVLQASTMAEALEMVTSHMPDLVLTATSLPDGTAADLCNTLRESQKTSIVPVLAIGSHVNIQTRLDTLRAGAFDVMSRPVNETLLLGRVRAMIRTHQRLAEWQLRDDTSYALGLSDLPAEFTRTATITLVGVDAAPLKGWVRQLLPHLRAQFRVTTLHDAMTGLHTGTPPDAVIFALPEVKEEAEKYLRLIPALRASGQTKNAALLVIQNTPAPGHATSALDVGADDVMIEGFNAPEAALRLQAMLSRKRQVAKILDSVRTGLREVVHDPLTGLYNRRYATPFMEGLIERSAATSSPFAIILADMDHFKRINDIYGHASGDAVLVETARRLSAAARSNDMIARMGGEEFLIAMPSTDIATAQALANRLCDAIGNKPFVIPGCNTAVPITISIGLTSSECALQPNRRVRESATTLIDQADKALYDAKMQGRNQVSQSRPQSRPAA